MVLNFVKKLLCLLGYVFILGIIAPALNLIFSAYSFPHPFRLKIISFFIVMGVLGIFFTWLTSTEKRIAKFFCTAFSIVSGIVLTCSFVFVLVGPISDLCDRYNSCIKILKSSPIHNYSNVQRATDYLRLISHASDKPIAHATPAHIHIHNFDVHYSSNLFHGLHLMFNEMFINEEYNFKAKTDSPFIIDCGCNIGLSILNFKMMYPHAKIIGFEPNDDCWDVLEKNINKNNLSDVTIYKKALSNKEGHIRFFYDSKNSANLGSSTIFKEGRPMEKVVEADLLSHYIDCTVDLIKIDVEGAEGEIIEDLEKNNKLQYIKEIILEFHQAFQSNSFDTNKKNSLALLLSILEKNNFAYVIKAKSKPLCDPKDTCQCMMIHACQKD